MKTWIAALALLCASSWAAAQAPIVIKFSHVVAPDTPKGKGAQRLPFIFPDRAVLARVTEGPVGESC